MYVYIAQRLQHASATLPGSATQPHFSLTGSHTLTSARHFPLFSKWVLIWSKECDCFLYFKSFIWPQQSGTVGFHFSFLKYYFRPSASYFCFLGLKKAAFLSAWHNWFHLWITDSNSFPLAVPLCPNGSGDETAETAVEITQISPCGQNGKCTTPITPSGHAMLVVMVMRLSCLSVFVSWGRRYYFHVLLTTSSVNSTLQFIHKCEWLNFIEILPCLCVWVKSTYMKACVCLCLHAWYIHTFGAPIVSLVHGDLILAERNAYKNQSAPLSLTLALNI